MTQMNAAEVSLNTILNELPTEDYLNSRLNESQQLTAEIIDELHLNNMIEMHGDFTQIRCFKTGRHLGTHSRDYLTRAFKTMDEDYCVELLMRENISKPAVHWIRDDGISLEKLILSDPAGYFVYAAGYVLSPWSPQANIQLKYHLIKSPDLRHSAYKEHKIAEWEWVDQKATAFKLVESCDPVSLVRVNEVLRKWLAFFDTCQLPENLIPFEALVRHREDNDILIAAAENIERFERLVNHAFRATLLKLNKNHEIDPRTDFNRLYQFKAKYGGHGNFFNQRQGRNQSFGDTLYHMIKTELDQAGIHDMSLRNMESKKVAITSKGEMVHLEQHQTLAHVYKPGQKIKIQMKKKDV